MTDEVKKQVANEISIDADAATVWRAISDGEELKRWFPLDARVTPGVGGSMWLSWGENAEWETPIEIWEPNRRLQTMDRVPVKMAVDYYIEAKGGETVLRIVQSGFSAEAWDDEVELTTNAGWRTFLANLKLYLEHHRGEPREMVHLRHPVVPIGREEAFRRTLGVFGFDPQATYAPSERFEVEAGGERLTGVVNQFVSPVNLTATLDDYDHAFLMIEIEPGKGRCRPAFWLSLYGDARRHAPELRDRLDSRMHEAFADLVP